MIRKIIHIDEEKCNGCGLCAKACQEGALAIVDGKARLMREDYCDGLGNCLPACPMNAIRFVEREAAAFDEAAVTAHLAQKKAPAPRCPGSRVSLLRAEEDTPQTGRIASQLRQWPVQLKLAPTRAPYFTGAKMLIAADCTAYTCGNFHSEFMRGRITLIGCPKLDEGDYAEKLREIFSLNDIASVTVVRMEVPCCGGLPFAVEKAIRASGKQIPLRVVILNTRGELVRENPS